MTPLQLLMMTKISDDIDDTKDEGTNNDDTNLGKGNIIFCCTGLTNPYFWQIKIIIVISHTNFSFFLFTIYITSNRIFFFQVTLKYI